MSARPSARMASTTAEYGNAMGASKSTIVASGAIARIIWMSRFTSPEPRPSGTSPATSDRSTDRPTVPVSRSQACQVGVEEGVERHDGHDLALTAQAEGVQLVDAVGAPHPRQEAADRLRRVAAWPDPACRRTRAEANGATTAAREAARHGRGGVMAMGEPSSRSA